MEIRNTNITINIKDLEKSLSFYQSIGFSLKSRWGYHYVQLTAPGIVLGLHPSDEISLTAGSGNVSIGFTTDTFEKTKSDLQKLYITGTEMQEDGGQFLHFKDPD